MALSYITSLEIDYLTKLDYPSLKRLCCVNKYFSTLLTNQRLRPLLRNDQIKIPLGLDIKRALDELYSLVVKLVHKNHPTIPIWVNKLLFMMERMEEMYLFIFTGLLNYLEWKGFDESTFDKPLRFNISISPFNIDGSWRESGYDQESITLPDEFTKYISFTILNWCGKEPMYMISTDRKHILVALVYDLFWLNSDKTYYLDF